MQRNAVSACLAPVLRVVCLSVPVLTLFAATALACAGLVVWRLQTPLFSSATFLPSVVCGLIVWLFAAAMHLKKEAAVLPVFDFPSFRQRLRADLVELGYVPTEVSEHTIVFKPSFTSYLLGGWIAAAFEPGKVRLVGPKAHLERLVRRLRLISYVQRDHKSAATAVLRQGRNLVKRAQISFRVSPEQWSGVHDGVLRCLASEGTDVICEVNLLAQSEAGLPLAVLDGVVNEWLRQNQIEAVIHKEFVEPSGVNRVAEASPMA
jgi:hypothetical protein